MQLRRRGRGENERPCIRVFVVAPRVIIKETVSTEGEKDGKSGKDEEEDRKEEQGE